DHVGESRDGVPRVVGERGGVAVLEIASEPVVAQGDSARRLEVAAGARAGFALETPVARAGGVPGDRVAVVVELAVVDDLVFELHVVPAERRLAPAPARPEPGLVIEHALGLNDRP